MFSQLAPHTLSCLLISVKVETLGITNDFDKFALANWIFEVCIVCTISLNAAIIHCKKTALQLRSMTRRAFSSYTASFATIVTQMNIRLKKL